MRNSQTIVLMLVFFLPAYGFLAAKIVGEFFAERPVAWEWTKRVIDVICCLVIINALS